MTSAQHEAVHLQADQKKAPLLLELKFFVENFSCPDSSTLPHCCPVIASAKSKHFSDRRSHRLARSKGFTKFEPLAVVRQIEPIWCWFLQERVNLMSFPLFTHARSVRIQVEGQPRENTLSFSHGAEMDSTSVYLNDLLSSNLQPRTFELFPLLPFELQLHIWTLAFEERRVIPVYIAPASHTPACALMRFLRSTPGPGIPYTETHTRPLPSLKTAPYACRASFDIYKRLYRSMSLMRGDRAIVEAKFSHQDVIFFKMGLSSKMHTHLSLTAFVRFQPEAAKWLKRIALETIGDLEILVPVLKGFQSLEEVVIVLPAARDVDLSTCNLTDALENFGGLESESMGAGIDD
ncbi:hypothetical protein VTL71DRAFT_22 [Oculimacula yallundae]|uniref:2EXR domain-containing protein n=1 Tax=Oculimacula yallundae TaxID=86028 RepID=A0ABR4CYX4_9HELO